MIKHIFGAVLKPNCNNVFFRTDLTTETIILWMIDTELKMKVDLEKQFLNLLNRFDRKK
jgi:hypothetical protein